VGGEGFAVDASLIKADANKQRSVPGDKGQPIAPAADFFNTIGAFRSCRPSPTLRRADRIREEPVAVC
jgi:hypothetical protein